MTFGDWVLSLSVLLYVIAGIAFIVQGRFCYGIAWLCYAAANAAFVGGSLLGKGL